MTAFLNPEGSKGFTVRDSACETVLATWPSDVRQHPTLGEKIYPLEKKDGKLRSGESTER
jgi:hypothetical protein